ncbi:MAG: DotA/TraY family protein [Pseudomonadota bacterium]
MTVVKYAVLPRVLPRIYDLFGTGFATLAYFMALVFAATRLLPPGHPYLMANNIGRFGIRHVFAAAFNNIVMDRRNIDQIIVLFMLLLAIALLMIQVGLLLYGFAVPAAHAFTNMFTITPDRAQNDIAFILLDRVFGIPGLYNSCVSTSNCLGMDADFNFDPDNPIYTPPTFPWPFHRALHSLFAFYSTALLIVAAMIIMYFVMVIAVETAQTGTPFGKRFNTVWAPIRLVVALGLLVPLSNGMNAAQYIVLHSAKYGSNLASNGWVGFNQSLQAEFMSGNEMVASPSIPNLHNLVSFMTLARACQIVEDTGFHPTYHTAGDKDQILNETSGNYTGTGSTQASRVKATGGAPGGGATSAGADASIDKVHMYMVQHPLRANNRMVTDNTGVGQLKIDDVLTFTRNTDVTVRFGDGGVANRENEIELGNVSPDCGELTLSVQDFRYEGPRLIMQAYLNAIDRLWYDERIISVAMWYVNRNHRDIRSPDGQMIAPYKNLSVHGGASASNILNNAVNPSYDIAAALAAITADIRADMLKARNEAVKAEQQGYARGGTSSAGGQSRFAIPAQLLERGWGGAGIWYNKIAELNGAMVASLANAPKISRYPRVMSEICSERRATAKDVNGIACFEPVNTADRTQTTTGRRGPEDAAIGRALYSVVRDGERFESDFRDIPKTGNVIFDMINTLFGTEALLNLRSPENRDVHPLAQLAAVGRGLINATITNLTFGFAAKLGTIPTSGGASQLLGTIGGLLLSVATLTMTVGFVLYYVIPFLPFLYFFFAVGTWVKGIFEAVVGVPLWALAHLRIDGNGLPGDAATNGYFMIFEIFLRPILSVFGLLAAVTTFAASAHVLNDIFPDVLANVTGFDQSAAGANPGLIEKMRGPVDQLFFTVLYAIIMYMLATTSFKLIDQIPNQIIRWMGSSASTFSDFNQDSAQQLTQYAAISGSTIIQQSVGQVSNAMDGVSKMKGLFSDK